MYYYIFVMKKIKIIIILFLVLPLGFTACIKEGDFDTDKISLRDLHPTFFIPLIQDTLTLNRQPNISNDNDTSVIFYNIDNISLPTKEKWFAVPDVNNNLSLHYNYPSPVPFFDMDDTLTVSFPLLTANGQELDSLFCSGLPVKITLTGIPQLELVEVTFPQILVNGKPYTQLIAENAVPGTHTINVPACKIEPKDKKQLEIQVHLKGRIYASLNANLNVQIHDIQNYYTGLFGYFGQETWEIKDSIDLDILDDLNITADVLQFDILKIATKFQNSMGIPLRLTLARITAYGKNGQQLATTQPNKSIDVLARQDYTGNTAHTDRVLLCDGLGNILNEDTRKVVFSFACSSNPDGNQRNFLAATDFIQAAVDVRIPLVLKAKQLQLQDTININMSSVSLEDLKLQMYYKNSLPAKITLNIVLLDENHAPSATLISNLTIAKPADADEVDVEETRTITKDVFNKLKTATQALATVDIDTETPDYVIFKRDNRLTVKIGAAAKFTYDDLFND